MSNLVIEVLSASVTSVPTQRGSYQVCELAYKNKSFQDKVEGKKIMSFAEPDAFSILSKASMGQVFTIGREKDDKGYWKWKQVTEGNAPTQTNSGATNVAGPVTVNKPQYETADERAARQVMIVRQSSLAQAVALLSANGGKKNSPQDVISIAKVFENWVMTGDSGSIADMPEDPL